MSESDKNSEAAKFWEQNKKEPDIESLKERTETPEKKFETEPTSESGKRSPERPERGLQFWLWKMAERILHSDRKREILKKRLKEKVKTKEHLPGGLIIMEILLRRMTRRIFIPTIRVFMGKYRESYDTLRHDTVEEKGDQF